MKKCVWCKKSGFSDSLTECPDCHHVLLTVYDLDPAASTTQTGSAQRPTGSTRRRATAEEPAPAPTSRTGSTRPRAAAEEPAPAPTSRTGSTRPRATAEEPAPAPTSRTGSTRPRTNTGTTPPPPSQRTRTRRNAPDPALIVRGVQIAASVLMILGAVGFILMNWEAIAQFLRYFAAGMFIGIVLTLVIGRFRVGPRAVIGIGAIFGVLTVVFCYNMFDVNGAVMELVTAFMPIAIIIGGILLLFRSAR